MTEIQDTETPGDELMRALAEGRCSRRKFLTRAAALGISMTTIGSLLAACGGQAAETQGPTPTTAASGSAWIDEVNSRLEAARGIPKFTPPGPAVDATGLAGKKLAYVAITFNVETVQTVYNGVKEAAAAVGMTSTVFDAKGQPPLYIQGMQQAVDQRVDCIVIESIDARLIAEPMKRAKDAGIKIVYSNEIYLPEWNVTAPDAQVAFDYSGGSRLDADWLLSDSGGKDIDLLIIRAPSERHMSQEKAFKEQLDQYIKGQYQVRTEAVQFADFATRLPTLTRTVVNSDPKLNYILSVIDAPCLNIVPALHQANAQDRVKVVTYNATASILNFVKQRDCVLADPGAANFWEGWTDVDQAVRLLTGNPPVPGESKPPNRLFDITNIDSIDLKAPDQTWYDTESAKLGFKQLWGVA